jgi:hypothetical protein
MKRDRRLVLPQDLDKLKERARRAIAPIEPAPAPAGRTLEFLLKAQRTNAGRSLPPYYLVYFLLVELLEFQDLGEWEKTAWNVPIGVNGKTFTIEYRKFGLGVFTPDAKNDEEDARRIVALIKRGVTVAEPFFEWLASNAVRESKINVQNQSGWLLERYRYLRDRFREANSEAERRKDERYEEVETAERSIATTVTMPWYELHQNARWLGLGAVDAFFAWTEHVFIHLAILQGRLTTGNEVAELAEAEWQVKFKTAMNLNEPGTKALFDKLVLVRRQLRNFMAHGAFGKRGEAFKFHSRAGAVPVLLTHRPGRGRFSLDGEPAFHEQQALESIEEFIAHLWSGVRTPARVHLEDVALPTILPLASDGTYAAAMRSAEDMQEFVERLGRSFDRAANMDW